ncbi:MAG TPA: HypC/HybG/HupF family hydrogenase formation chaperone [Egibacteraceae bacterium]|nr:HypC/HybG/HupF family hydrogenase formation chaperone [Egibacteraceae bacterium]
MSDPARIIEVAENGGEAVVELRGARRRLSVALLALEGRPVHPGDWVLASAGMAIERIDEAQALELLQLVSRTRDEEDQA